MINFLYFNNDNNYIEKLENLKNDPKKSGVPNQPPKIVIDPIASASLKSTNPTNIETVDSLMRQGVDSVRSNTPDLTARQEDVSRSKDINYSESLPRTAVYGIEGGQTAIRDTDNISGEQEQSATSDVVKAFSGGLYSAGEGLKLSKSDLAKLKRSKKS